jgi:hypothetical protein
MDMDKKTSSIITVVATTLLCGLPGFIGICLGMMAIVGTFLPDSGIPAEDVGLAVGASITIVGLSLICIVIPIGIGLWTWRSYQKEKTSIEQTIIPEDDF